MRRALVVLQVLAVVVLGSATVARFHVWPHVELSARTPTLTCRPWRRTDGCHG